MTTLREIRRRIRSIEKIRQITRAMKTVAMVKLMRFQAQCMRLKPYAQKMRTAIAELSERTQGQSHPLLSERPIIKRMLLVVLTSDQGLCGAFNHNIVNSASRFLEEHREREVELWTIGKRGRDGLGRQGYRIALEYTNFYRTMGFKDAAKLGTMIKDRFLGGTLDAVVLVYNEFKSLVQQQVVREQVLPITIVREEPRFPEYIYEPDPFTVLDQILPLYLNTELWRALLESVASEHAARMNAMDAAAQNAYEMITDLTLYYNKARQAAITKELSEITTAAEAFRML